MPEEDGYEYSFTTADKIRSEMGTDIEGIDLYVNSIGGNAGEGEEIIKAIESAGVPITVYVEDIAASMAAFTVAYFVNRGSDLYITDDAMFMYHSARSTEGGTSKELFELAEQAEQFDSKQADELAPFLGKDKDEVLEEMEAETWLEGRDLIKMDIAKRHKENSRLAASVRNEDIYNRNKPNKPMSDFTKIAAALGDPELGESGIIQKAKKINEDLQAKTDKISALTDEKSKLEAKVGTLEASITELKNKNAKNEASALVAKYENDLGHNLAEKDDVKGRAVRYALQSIKAEADVEREDAVTALKSYIKAHGAPVKAAGATERGTDNPDGLGAIEKIEAKAKEQGISFEKAYGKYAPQFLEA